MNHSGLLGVNFYDSKRSSPEMIEIDGGRREGGGHILCKENKVEQSLLDQDD